MQAELEIFGGKNESELLVIIDSCYASGAWRSPSIRSIKLLDTPNLAGDCEATQNYLSVTSNRNAVQQFSWAINPKGLTVMTACAINESAQEEERENEKRGIFTYELVKSLEQLSIKSDYRTIRDDVEAKVKQAHSAGQKPQVHCQDRLLFFQAREPELLYPIICNIAQCGEERITIPLGSAQGVREKTEFRLFPPPSDVSFEVETVDDFACRARIPQSFPIEQLHDSRVYLAKWALSEPQRNFYLQSGFVDRFEKLLRQILAENIADGLNFIKLENRETQTNGVTLRENENRGVSIYGPNHLIAHEGPAWVVDLQDNDEERLVKETAIAAAHLARHIHIYEIKNDGSGLKIPFDIDLNQTDSGQIVEVFNNSSVELTFVNRGEDELFLTVMFFGPGFCIQQINPSSDSSITILPRREKKFKYQVEIPSELEKKREAGGGPQNRLYREILRVIVTTGNSYSFKSLEMPEIWEVIRSKMTNAASKGVRNLRNVEHVSNDWWMRDITVFVKA